MWEFIYLFISNSLDNVFEFVLQYIQRVENKQIKGVVKMFKKFILGFVLLLSFNGISFAEDNSNNLLFLGEGKG